MTPCPPVFAMLAALLGSCPWSQSNDEPAAAAAAAVEPAEEAVPSALEPFAHLIGQWKGRAIPADNPIRGWAETHEWAWAFEDGSPVAMDLTFEGGKVLGSGRLTHDPEADAYRLEGPDPAGEAIAFEGVRDPETGTLTLDRRMPGPKGAERITIRPNSNGIRYDFWFDRKGPGAPQYDRLIRANLGKVGETFAAGGASSRGPACIVTGGAATIAVSAGGTTFAVCCSGCRDEVLDHPEKYAAKLKARLTADGDAPDAIRTGSGDGSFGPSTPRPETEPEPEPGSPPVPDAEPDDEPEPEAPEADPAARRKAASVLRLGQALEKQGKAEGALTFYRRVVDNYPETPEADTARERIEALEDDD